MLTTTFVNLYVAPTPTPNGLMTPCWIRRIVLRPFLHWTRHAVGGATVRASRDGGRAVRSPLVLCISHIFLSDLFALPVGCMEGERASGRADGRRAAIPADENGSGIAVWREINRLVCIRRQPLHPGALWDGRSGTRAGCEGRTRGNWLGVRSEPEKLRGEGPRRPPPHPPTPDHPSEWINGVTDVIQCAWVIFARQQASGWLNGVRC